MPGVGIVLSLSQQLTKEGRHSGPQTTHANTVNSSYSNRLNYRWTIVIVTPPCIWHSYRRRGCAVHAQVLPSPVCSEPAPNKWFLGRTWVHIQSDTSVGSSVFVELTVSSVYSTHVDFGEIPFPSLPVPLSFLPSLPSPLEVGTPTATRRSGGERISLMTNYSCV